MDGSVGKERKKMCDGKGGGGMKERESGGKEMREREREWRSDAVSVWKGERKKEERWWAASAACKETATLRVEESSTANNKKQRVNKAAETCIKWYFFFSRRERERENRNEHTTSDTRSVFPVRSVGQMTVSVSSLLSQNSKQERNEVERRVHIGRERERNLRLRMWRAEISKKRCGREMYLFLTWSKNNPHSRKHNTHEDSSTITQDILLTRRKRIWKGKQEQSGCNFYHWLWPKKHSSSIKHVNNILSHSDCYLSGMLVHCPQILFTLSLPKD